MAGIWDANRVPVWVVRFRPFDPDAGVERNVWLASQYLQTDEPFEGWLHFDGTDDRVRVADPAGLDFGSLVEFAVGVRWRTSVSQTAVLVGKGISSPTAGGPGWGIGLVSADSSVRGRISDGFNSSNPTSGTETPFDGNWHTAILWRQSGGNVLLYYDGVLQQTASGSGVGSLANSADLIFGEGADGTSDYSGDLERVVIIGDIANVSEIQSLLDSRDLTATVVDGTPITNLIAAWPINEGYGTKVQDVGGAELHGTLEAGTVTNAWSVIAPPPGTIPGVLTRPFSVSASLLRGDRRISLSALPSFGAVESDNPDGLLDNLFAYTFDRRLADIRRGFTDQQVSELDSIFVGQCEEVDKGTRTKIAVPLRGIEDVFETDLQPRKYEPGYEPYTVYGTVDSLAGATFDDFGNVLNRTTGAFTFGVAFRTTASGSTMALYGKKNAFASNVDGYALAITNTGDVSLQLADGAAQFNVTATPSTPINDGKRHTLVGEVQAHTGGAATAFLYLDGTQVGSTTITTMGSISNTVSLRAGANAAGGNLFTGEIERLIQDTGSGSTIVDAIHAALNERYADDVDATGFGHYVPMTENFGITTGDASPSGFHGTLNGIQGTGSGYLVNAGPGLAIGTTVIPVDTGTGTILVGDLVQFGGSGPQYEVTVALSAGSFTIAAPGLFSAVADNATVTIVGNLADHAWSGTPNGNRDVEGKPVPILLGRASVVRGVLVDPVKLIWQIADASLFDIFSNREGFVPKAEDTTTTGSIFRVSPQAAKWRWATGTFGGNTGTFARLRSQPSGTVTWSADSVDLTSSNAAAYPGALATEIVARVLPGESVFDEGTLATDAPYLSGAYWDEETSAASALEEILAGAGAAWTVDPRNAYDLNGKASVIAFQVKDVSGETPVATYRLDPDEEVSDFARDGFEQIGIAPVYKTVTLRHTRYKGHLTSASEPSLVSAGPPPVLVPMSVINEILREWRSLTYPQLLNTGGVVSTTPEIEAMRDFLGAEDFERDTAIWSRPPARTEAERLFNLHAQQLRAYRGELIGYQFTHRLGDVIDVEARRFLADGGSTTVTKRFLVVGVNDDARRSGTQLDLWGGWEPKA